VGFHLWKKFVTNQTGNTARLALEIRDIHMDSDEAMEFRDAAIILVCFMGGAFLCGLLIDRNQVQLGGKSSYGLALVGNALLLVIATVASLRGTSAPHISGAYFAAAASGLQNAMCTSHFGAVIRTTHITGTVTDIGSTIGRMVCIFLRKRCRMGQLNIVEKAEIEVDKKKLLVLLPLLFGFWLGCFLGAYLEFQMHEYALLVPASFTGVVGVIYMFFRNCLKEKLKKIEMKRLTEDLLEVDGALGRAQTKLAELRQQHHQNSEQTKKGAVVDLDEEVERALEVVHDMEMTLDEMRSEHELTPKSSAPQLKHAATC
jgi:uncharacterized membrane protein YoaK (UPF0700 family)